MDRIFDEKENSVMLIQPRPLQEMISSVPLDFDMLKKQSCFSRADDSYMSTTNLTSDILRDEMEEIYVEDLPIAPHNVTIERVDVSIFDTTPTADRKSSCGSGDNFIMSSSMEECMIFPTPLALNKRDFENRDSTNTRPSKKTRTEEEVAYSDSEDSDCVIIEDDAARSRFKEDQTSKLMEKFEEIIEYHKKHGLCQDPYSYQESPTLARWAKRQRYQFTLFQDGKPSTMTEERISRLEELGFVWDSYSAPWKERYNELQDWPF
jgi:hypothetical protein